MKRILSMTALSGLAVFVFTTSAFCQQHTKTPDAPKTEKHIKMIKIDDDGNKSELDTIIHGDQVFVWHGDTIGGKKDLKWLSKDDIKMDSLHQNFDMNFEYNIEDDGEGNVMIMKSGKGGKHMIMTPALPGAPVAPHAPRMMFFGDRKSKNVIDLSDPGIISYDKKMLKNGTEKITIVRKPVEENEEEVIMGGPAGNQMIWHEAAPVKAKTINVIKSDDGTTEIIENEDVMHMKGGQKTMEFVGDDGKVMIIKEIKDGDEKKIEVEVEEKTEKENN